VKIVNPQAISRQMPVYASYKTNDISGYRYEFCHWTDEIVKMIDRQLEYMGAGELPPAPGVELTDEEKKAEWYRTKRREHIAFMEKVLGKPSSEEENNEALAAHKYYTLVSVNQ